MYSRLLRNFINLILCLAGFFFCITLSFVMVLANYLACEVSFELLGYDGQPLFADKLVGPFLGTFLNKATLTHLYAMVVALVVSLGIFMTCRLLFQIFELIKDRNQYRTSGDEQSSKIARQMILWNFVQLLAFGIPLAFVINWDIELFRFRAVAGALSIENSELATRLSNWGLQLQEKGNFWAWAMTQIGAWGYMGITALGCLGLEYSMRRTADHWTRFSSSIEELFNAPPAQGEHLNFYGYDQYGQPVYDPNTQIVYDTEGNPVNQSDVPSPPFISEATGRRAEDDNIQEGSHPQQSEITVHPQEGLHQNDKRSEGLTIETVAEEYTPTQNPLFDPEQAHRNEINQTGTNIEPQPNSSSGDSKPDEKTVTALILRTEEGTPQEIIGSTNGEKVSLTTALAHPELYWVDPDTHQIWDSNYRETLFADEKKLAA